MTSQEIVGRRSPYDSDNASGQKMEGLGEEIFTCEPSEAPPPARSEQDATEKFCFPFRGKDRARANP
ncbi:MAG: hypothetical protein Q8R40_02955, partial [bacterium]|nr:hypothetical protein [bacterium]